MTDQNNPETNKTKQKKIDTKEYTKKIGNYILFNQIGMGTFSKVTKGIHILTEQEVAVKILDKEKIQDSVDIERIIREIEILKNINHPNICQIYETYSTIHNFYLILEFIQGGDLFDFISSANFLSEQISCKFFRQLIGVIEYLTDMGISHRDIKPENILLNKEHTLLKVIDFGLSNYCMRDEYLKSSCGSPCYASPEMLSGKPYHGITTDLWSSGIVLYSMLVGSLPFDDQELHALYEQIKIGKFYIPSTLSLEAIDFLKRLLMVDPEKRITLEQVKEHPWFNMEKTVIYKGIDLTKEVFPSNDRLIRYVIDRYFDPNEINFSSFVSMIQGYACNRYTATYFLVKKTLEENDLDEKEFLDEFFKMKNMNEELNKNIKVEVNNAEKEVQAKNNTVNFNKNFNSSSKEKSHKEAEALHEKALKNILENQNNSLDKKDEKTDKKELTDKITENQSQTPITVEKKPKKEKLKIKATPTRNYKFEGIEEKEIRTFQNHKLIDIFKTKDSNDENENQTNNNTNENEDQNKTLKTKKDNYVYKSKKTKQKEDKNNNKNLIINVPSSISNNNNNSKFSNFNNLIKKKDDLSLFASNNLSFPITARNETASEENKANNLNFYVINNIINKSKEDSKSSNPKNSKNLEDAINYVPKTSREIYKKEVFTEPNNSENKLSSQKKNDNLKNSPLTKDKNENTDEELNGSLKKKNQNQNYKYNSNVYHQKANRHKKSVDNNLLLEKISLTLKAHERIQSSKLNIIDFNKYNRVKVNTKNLGENNVSKSPLSSDRRPANKTNEPKNLQKALSKLEIEVFANKLKRLTNHNKTSFIVNNATNANNDKNKNKYNSSNRQAQSQNKKMNNSTINKSFKTTEKNHIKGNSFSINYNNFNFSGKDKNAAKKNNNNIPTEENNYILNQITNSKKHQRNLSNNIKFQFNNFKTDIADFSRNNNNNLDAYKSDYTYNDNNTNWNELRFSGYGTSICNKNLKKNKSNNKNLKITQNLINFTTGNVSGSLTGRANNKNNNISIGVDIIKPTKKTSYNISRNQVITTNHINKTVANVINASQKKKNVYMNNVLTSNLNFNNLNNNYFLKISTSNTHNNSNTNSKDKDNSHFFKDNISYLNTCRNKEKDIGSIKGQFKSKNNRMKKKLVFGN